MRYILTLIAALAATTAAAADKKRTSGKEDDAKLVCIKEPQIGSRFSKKVCKSQAEWDEERRLAREILDRSTRVQTNPVG